MIHNEEGSDNTRPAPEALGHLEQFAVRTALRDTKGNKTRATAILGITPTQLYTRVKRYGLAS